jgi:catechol 2,3-dioxygenase-like lactoylglutathione lyase family enzyme
MTGERLTVEHILQPALLCRDIDQTMDFLHGLLGIYPSERVDIRNTGVNNAVYALDGQTFLELIEPYDPDCAAIRLLNRYGEGWHMISVDLVDGAPEAVARGLEAAGVRVVRENSTRQVKRIWHLHPRDTHGVLLAVALRVDHDDNSAWAGAPWREYVRTNTRVIRSILGVSLVSAEPAAMAETYTALGFRFGQPYEDEGDTVQQAITPRGTFLQIRSPIGPETPSAAWLRRRGAGLYHLAFEADDLSLARVACERMGVRVARESRPDGAATFWTEPETSLGVPIEFRQSRRGSA